MENFKTEMSGHKNEKDHAVRKLIILLIIALLLALLIWRYFDYKIEQIKFGSTYPSKNVNTHFLIRHKNQPLTISAISFKH